MKAENRFVISGEAPKAKRPKRASSRKLSFIIPLVILTKTLNQECTLLQVTQPDTQDLSGSFFLT